MVEVVDMVVFGVKKMLLVMASVEAETEGECIGVIQNLAAGGLWLELPEVGLAVVGGLVLLRVVGVVAGGVVGVGVVGLVVVAGVVVVVAVLAGALAVVRARVRVRCCCCWRFCRNLRLIICRLVSWLTAGLGLMVSAESLLGVVLVVEVGEVVLVGVEVELVELEVVVVGFSKLSR